MFYILVTLSVSSVTEVEWQVRSPAPQIPPTMLKNKQDIVVMYVY